MNALKIDLQNVDTQQPVNTASIHREKNSFYLQKCTKERL